MTPKALSVGRKSAILELHSLSYSIGQLSVACFKRVVFAPDIFAHRHVEVAIEGEEVQGFARVDRSVKREFEKKLHWGTMSPGFAPSLVSVNIMSVPFRPMTGTLLSIALKRSRLLVCLVLLAHGALCQHDRKVLTESLLNTSIIGEARSVMSRSVATCAFILSETRPCLILVDAACLLSPSARSTGVAFGARD
jgi:hypothetical protein